MPDLRDPLALLEHAAAAGDIQLVELMRARLFRAPPRDGPGSRAYGTLVGLLRLKDFTGPADDRRDDDASS
jgi:hypothetical protein